MGLRQELTAMRLAREAKRNPEWVRIMNQATDDLCDSGIADRVLKPGAKAPEFSLSNANGEQRNSRDWLAKGPLVVSFYRGVWWPYCNLELVALENARPEFESLGATLVVVSPQVPEYLRHSKEKNGLNCEVLGDPGNKVAGQFGLVFQIPEELKQVYTAMKIDLPRYNGDDSWQLPMTSRFIIDRAGIIRHAVFHPDYTIRPDPTETLAALRALSA